MRGILATIQFRIFSFPVSFPKTYRLKYTKQIYLLFCMGVNLRLSH